MNMFRPTIIGQLALCSAHMMMDQLECCYRVKLSRAMLRMAGCGCSVIDESMSFSKILAIGKIGEIAIYKLLGSVVWFDQLSKYRGSIEI